MKKDSFRWKSPPANRVDNQLRYEETKTQGKKLWNSSPSPNIRSHLLKLSTIFFRPNFSCNHFHPVMWWSARKWPERSFFASIFIGCHRYQPTFKRPTNAHQTGQEKKTGSSCPQHFFPDQIFCCCCIGFDGVYVKLSGKHQFGCENKVSSTGWVYFAIR